MKHCIPLACSLFRHPRQKFSQIRKGFAAAFITTDEKSGGAIETHIFIITSLISI